MDVPVLAGLKAPSRNTTEPASSSLTINEKHSLGRRETVIWIMLERILLDHGMVLRGTEAVISTKRIAEGHFQEIMKRFHPIHL